MPERENKIISYLKMSREEAVLTLVLLAALVFVWAYNPDSTGIITSAPAESFPYDGPYYVEKVVDGDTIKLDMDGKITTVRLIGIDTPESVHPNKEKNVPEGKVASDYMKELAEDKYAYIEYGENPHDRYDRVLAYVYVDDNMINETMLKEGYAKVYTIKPNDKYEEYFKMLEQDAKSNNRGLWSTGVFDE